MGKHRGPVHRPERELGHPQLVIQRAALKPAQRKRLPESAALLNRRPVSRMRTSSRPSSIRVRRDGANPDGRYVELPRKNSEVCRVLLS